MDHLGEQAPDMKKFSREDFFYDEDGYLVKSNEVSVDGTNMEEEEHILGGEDSSSGAGIRKKVLVFTAGKLVE